MSALVPNLWSLVPLTLVLGGSAAFVSGRALAAAWRAPFSVVLAALPLAGAARFLHYALAGESSDFLQGALTWTLLAAIAYSGFLQRRAGQMAAQYPWLAGS